MARQKTEKKETKPKQQGNLQKIGALWLNRGKKGMFMSGRIEISEEEEIRVLVFKNGFKEQSKHPDYIIYEPSENEGQAEKTKAITDEDIPF